MPVQLGDGGYNPVASLKPRKAVGSDLGGGGVANTTTPKALPSLAGAIGSGGGGGGTQTTTTVMQPNQVYQDEILSAPESVAAQGFFGAQTSNLAAARADAIQRAVISSGWSPGSLGGSLSSYAGDITPDTLASAAANPMSQKAQLDLQLQQANQNQPYDLAARGMGRSGAAAINQGNLQRQYQTASYQGMQGLLDSIYGAANTYAGGYNNAVSQLENARAMAAQRLQQAAGYSQSITTSGGGDDGSGATDPFYGDPMIAGQGYTPPNTSQVVQKVIASLGKGASSNPRRYQDVRNILAG